MKGVKLYELKRGDRFYSEEGIIYTFIECNYSENNPDFIEYAVKKFKTNDILKFNLNGYNVRDRLYTRYNGRDRGSFLAGFYRGINLCRKEMGQFDKENAGIDNPINVYFTMLKEYNNWKLNIDENQ